jgi:hypothetical protein
MINTLSFVFPCTHVETAVARQKLEIEPMLHEHLYSKLLP